MTANTNHGQKIGNPAAASPPGTIKRISRAATHRQTLFILLRQKLRVDFVSSGPHSKGTAAVNVSSLCTSRPA